MKKSVISAVCSAVLLVMFSVNAFAAVPYHPVPDEPLINVEDGDTVIGTLKTSELGTKEKAFLREWLTSPSNICAYNNGNVLLYIIDNCQSIIFSPSSYNSLSASGAFDFSMLSFSLTTGKVTSELSLGSYSCMFGFIFSGSFFEEHPPTFTNASIIEYDGRLLIRDDGGIFGDEEPPASSSDPDTPPDFKPEPPSDPFIPPAPPSFDFGGTTGDLPYDSSIWEALMWYLRDTIGSVGTVLLWVLMIIIAIPTVISAIRHFMNQSGGDGNNTSGLI